MMQIGLDQAGSPSSYLAVLNLRRSLACAPWRTSIQLSPLPFCRQHRQLGNVQVSKVVVAPMLSRLLLHPRYSRPRWIPCWELQWGKMWWTMYIRIASRWLLLHPTALRKISMMPVRTSRIKILGSGVQLMLYVTWQIPETPKTYYERPSWHMETRGIPLTASPNAPLVSNFPWPHFYSQYAFRPSALDVILAVPRTLQPASKSRSAMWDAMKPLIPVASTAELRGIAKVFV